MSATLKSITYPLLSGPGCRVLLMAVLTRLERLRAERRIHDGPGPDTAGRSVPRGRRRLGPRGRDVIGEVDVRLEVDHLRGGLGRPDRLLGGIDRGGHLLRRRPPGYADLRRH